MKNKAILMAFIAALSLVAPGGIKAFVDGDSVFHEARYPASILDLNLSHIQALWRQLYFFSPNEESKRKYPLITKSGLTVELYHSREDKISVTGWIRNLKEFLKFSATERKSLVSNTLELVKSHLFMDATLVDKKTGEILHKQLQSHHIELKVIISGLSKNDKNEYINKSLPGGLGFGFAGYKNGQFVFNKTYFIDLKVNGGVAISGNPNEFVIENEK